MCYEPSTCNRKVVAAQEFCDKDGSSFYRKVLQLCGLLKRPDQMYCDNCLAEIQLEQTRNVLEEYE